MTQPHYIDAGETICTVTFAKRPDGGMRVFSGDLPGLILSHSDPDKVAADVWPAIKALIERGATRRPAPMEAVAWRENLIGLREWMSGLPIPTEGIIPQLRNVDAILQALAVIPTQPRAHPDTVEIVTEWLAMAKETPRPLHSSLNYVRSARQSLMR